MEQTLLLADAHELIRLGIRSLLVDRPEWRVVADATDAPTAVELALMHQPTIVILDVDLNGGGVEATRQIRTKLPQTEVLVLTVQDSEEIAREVLSAGAHGYLLKTEGASKVIDAIDALRDHRIFLPARFSQVVLSAYGTGQKDDGPPHNRLTTREKEILRLLAVGNTNMAIAKQLRISIRTVESHRANLMHKMGFGHLSDLIHYAYRHSLIG